MSVRQVASRSHGSWWLWVFVVSAFPVVRANGQEAAPGKQQQASQSESATSPDQAKLEKQFADKLSGATLVGRFTETFGGDQDRLTKEKYELTAVKKLQGNTWLFQTRIVYGNHNLSVPLSLPVLWAGDTPVITLDKMPVPGLGTFTARVLIYDDHYAGFWSGGDHGGHLFGKVVREKE